MGEWMKFVPFI
jgi:hypothetical protein